MLSAVSLAGLEEALLIDAQGTRFSISENSRPVN